jgi:ABC-type Mn2+/Zn2+ transport system permease subunit
VLSVAFSIIGTLAGLIWSYAYEWPSGASVVLALCGLFVISWALHGIRTAIATQK